MTTHEQRAAERRDGRGRSTGRLQPYLALALLTLAPLAGLGIYAYRAAAEAVTELVQASNRNAGYITGQLVEREFRHWENALAGFAAAPGVAEAVASGDEDAVRQRLKPLVEKQPRVVRAFVTDPEALLWSDYPAAPESLGRRFAQRDWYRGVSERDATYVSEVYQRHAEPRMLLLAVATPVRAPGTGEVAGYVVYQIELAGLTEVIAEVDVGRGGSVFVLDAAGMVAAHPHLDLQDRRYADYGDVLPRPGDNARTLRYEDPLLGGERLATVVRADVGGAPWTVVAQQPAGPAFRPVSGLAWQIGGAGILLTLVVGGLGLGVAREQGRRRRAEEALAAANEALEERVEERTLQLRQKEEQLLHAQKMEAIGQLAGGIAHDFNNLLSVILGYTEIALADLPDDAPLRPELEDIHEAGDRAAALTRQLLAFGRKQVLQPQILDVNEAVGRMDRMLRRVLGEDLDLETSLDDDLDPVEADPGQLEQIVMNLAVNARDAMPEGGKLTIETENVVLDENYVRTHADASPGPHVMLAISDTGSGMDADTLARIFEPFFTSKGLGLGTGLGLSTVYGIVKQSGGNIWVYSEKGRGTTFKVYLPSAAGQPAAAEPRRIEPVREPATGTILVVEDEPAVRRLVEEALRGGGYQVLAAATGSEAFELAETHDGPIDLLLTDVILPDVGGVRVAEHISARRPGVRVLYTSGYTDNAIVHRGVLDPGTPFLEKPIRPSHLLDKVRDVLAEPAPEPGESS